MRRPLDARLSDLRPLGGRPDGRATPAVPGRCHALARRRMRRVVRGVWPAHLPPGRSGRRGSQASNTQARLSRSRLRRPTPNERLRRCSGPAAWARCSGATPTTTQPSGTPRPSTSPSTSARSGYGEPTARPSPPSLSWRRSPALGDSPPQTTTRGSISSPRSSSSSRTWRCHASTLGIARASPPAGDVPVKGARSRLGGRRGVARMWRGWSAKPTHTTRCAAGSAARFSIGRDNCGDPSHDSTQPATAATSSTI